MMASASIADTAQTSIALFVATLLASARIQQRRWASNAILLIRRPLTPVLSFISIVLAYRISGQTAVDDENVVGFLIVGALALEGWNATIWSCGFGLQMDALQGTLPSILASPCNRLAVVMGYGVGDLVLSAPSVLLIMLVGEGFGAEYVIANPTIVIFALALVFISALTIGAAFSGLFILSRNPNPLANFLQAPVHLLAGFYFPRSVLPDWLEPVGGLLPITHALTALRASMLDGAGWRTVGHDLALSLLASGLFLGLGIWSLRRVDYELRRTGSLNLF